MTGKLEEDDVAKRWRMGDTLEIAGGKAVRRGLEAALCQSHLSALDTNFDGVAPEIADDSMDDICDRG
jgi:hypothetical protein